MNNIPHLIYGKKVWFVSLKLLSFYFLHLNKTLKNPFRTIRELNRIRKRRNTIHGKSDILKYVKSGKQYYWAAEFPGLPSDNLKHMINVELQRNYRNKDNALSIPQQTVVWGITNRCPLKCEHCYEWENIDTKDHLKFDDLKQILKKIEQQGIKHVQLSGGEPLVRFNDLVSILKEASQRIDFWLLTSGFGLTKGKAAALKEAGLIGVNISLDHWNDVAHNNFRNDNKSYGWVMEAVANCRNSGLLVSLSVCATKNFTTEKNLMAYLNLAKKLGAHFVRIMEPRQVGRFANQSVSLSTKQVEMISEITIKMNTHRNFKDFPIVAFFGYHQRKMGCFGAGNRFLYIDSMGEFHACPFCRGSVGHALSISFNDAIIKLRENKCSAFKAI